MARGVLPPLCCRGQGGLALALVPEQSGNEEGHARPVGDQDQRDDHHRQEGARIAGAAEAARQQKLADEQRALKENEDLLAKVDSDVSRAVPSAMEPLAQLMADDEPQ